MKYLLGQWDRTRLIGKELRTSDGWLTIKAADDGHRTIILTLSDDSIVEIGIWEEVEIRDGQKR